MEFNEFKQRHQRMCNTFVNCNSCLMNSVTNDFIIEGIENCYELIYDHYDQCVEAVLKWEKENGIRKTNKEIFLESIDDLPWQYKNEEGKVRCGYPICTALIPCADCGWWDEPENAIEVEKIYKDMATQELSQYKNIVMDSEMSETLKDELIKAIDGNTTNNPDLIIRKPNGETESYIIDSLGEHKE